MERLSDEDFQLSMRISPTARDAENNEGLRSLLVHRLVPGPKAVWRRSIADESKMALYCEPCRRWSRVLSFNEEFSCEGCRRVYRVEFSVLEEVVDDDDDESDEAPVRDSVIPD
jgi:hypothetical protein